MRLVFVIPYFYSAWQYGGTPKAAFELARGLIRRGHAVKVLTTDSAGNSRISPHVSNSRVPLQVEGIDVFRYRNLSNHLAFRHRLFLPPALFRNIRDQLADCDVLHIHELRNMVTVAAYRAARRLHLPFVLSPHGGLQRS